MKYKRTRKYKTKEFVKAIKGTGGIKTAIAKRLGCEWNTVTKYIKENEEIRSAWQAEKESILDLGEASLYSLVKKKDLAAIKYLLSTQGKERGYGDQQRVDIKQEGTIEHNHVHDHRLLPEPDRTGSVLDILESCGAFSPETKRLTKDDVEIISA